jgi:hypothetical protein
MGARNQVGIGLPYWPASLCSLAIQFKTWFLESFHRPVAGLKFSALVDFLQCPVHAPNECRKTFANMKSYLNNAFPSPNPISKLIRGYFI